MSGELRIVVTDAGIAEVVNAEKNGTAPVLLSHVAFGSSQYTPDAGQTAMKGEFKRFDSVSGGSVGDNTIHLTVSDASNDTYTVYEVGVFTESGTLFAIYSQNTPILQKASAAQALIAIDFVLTNVDPDSVTVGDASFILPPATTVIQGIVELATAEETITGSDATRAVTPASLSARTATTGRRGLVELATATEAAAGTDGDRAVTPYAMVAAFIRQHLETGYQKIPGGTVMQWGKALVANDGTTRIVFPSAFPNACAFAGAFSLDDVQPAFSVASMDEAAVNFKHTGNGGINSAWFAIGY